MKMKIITFIIVFLIISQLSLCDSVCDRNTLITEIEQDLADNGMLDCLRTIEAPHSVEETEKQKNLRLAAQWDSSCSFETTYNWFDTLKTKYGVNTLVDSVGEPVEFDFPDQADMCEIVRAAVAANLLDLKDLNMQKLPLEIVDKIDCAGSDDKEGPRICAVNGGSFFQSDSWTILLSSENIMLGGGPEFVASTPDSDTKTKSKYPSQNDNKSQLISDLLKFSSEQLESKEVELATLINKSAEESRRAEKGGKSGGQSSSNKNGSSNDDDDNGDGVFVHVKRASEIPFKSSKEDSYNRPDNTKISFKMDNSRIVFGFYMTSFSLKSDSKVGFYMTHDGKEIEETRQAVGPVSNYALTSAFAEVVDSNGAETVLNVLYSSNTNGGVDPNNDVHNFSYGSITMPEGHVEKYISAKSLTLKQANTWTAVPEFSLSVQPEKAGFYLIFYNFAANLPGKQVFSGRLTMDQKPMYESAAVSGPLDQIGLHSGFAVKISEKGSTFKFEYKYEGNDMINTDYPSKSCNQAITAFELPEKTVVTQYKVDKLTSLNTKGEWRGFGLNASVKVEGGKKTFLIIYNLNVKTDGASFAARVRVNSKYSRRSVFSVADTNYAHGQGYIVRILPEGRHLFDIEYKSDAETSISPGNVAIDSQNVTLQIIQLD